MNENKTIWAKTRYKLIVTAICIVGISATLLPRAEATPIVFGSNAYEFVQVSNPFTNNTWSAASAAASASVFNGANGHLATITSQAENNFIISLTTPLFTGFNGAWLGGDYQGWLEGPEAGSTFAAVGGYTNWNAFEPNNNGLMYMSIGTSTPNSGSSGAGNWVDDSGVQGTPSSADPVIGYFVEYENVASVPEPTTLVLLGLGLFGLCFNKRKRLL